MNQAADNREISPLLNIRAVSWVVFVALLAFSAAWLPKNMYWGVFAGGLVVVVNLMFLHRALVSLLVRGKTIALKRVLWRYYLLFALTVAALFLLLSLGLVNGLGLILGLSTFFLTILCVLAVFAGQCAFRKLNIKEAV